MDHQAFAQLLGNYGEFVGAIAVVATLVYLALQIRQNTHAMDENRKAVVAQAARDIDLYLAQFHFEIARDPELKRIAMTSLDEKLDLESRSTVEVYETYCLAQSFMQSMQASYRHSKLNLADPEQAQYHLGAAKGNLVMFPAWQQFWADQRSASLLTTEFMDAVDNHSGPVAGRWSG